MSVLTFDLVKFNVRPGVAKGGLSGRGRRGEKGKKGKKRNLETNWLTDRLKYRQTHKLKYRQTHRLPDRLTDRRTTERWTGLLYPYRLG